MCVKPRCSTSTGHVVNVDLLSASIVTRVERMVQSRFGVKQGRIEMSFHGSFVQTDKLMNRKS